MKLFPAQVEPPADDPQVARVLLNKVRLERTRQFGACWLGLELWRRLALDRFFEEAVDQEALCQEAAKAACCTEDEGGPFGAAL